MFAKVVIDSSSSDNILPISHTIPATVTDPAQMRGFWFNGTWFEFDISTDYYTQMSSDRSLIIRIYKVA
jgi:hypothetical protein